MLDILHNRDLTATPLINRNLAFVQPRYFFSQLSDDHNIVDYSSRQPNYGALQLLAYMRDTKLLGDIKYFEASASKTDVDLEKEVRRFFGSRQGILAATTYTASLNQVQQFFDRFEDSHFKVIGGPHATGMPDITFAHVAVRGEGEKTFEDVIKLFPKLDLINKGISYHANGVTRVTPAQFNLDLDAIPLPAFDLIGEYRAKGVYKTSLGKMTGDVGLYITSQSCIGDCSFCPTHAIHGKWRSKSVSKVLSELNKLIHTYGYSKIQFHDDTLLARRDLGEIVKFLKNNNIVWECFARANEISEKSLSEIAGSGLQHLLIGLESGLQSQLDYFRKKTTPQQNARALRLTDAFDISTEGCLIIGAPHDTVTSINNSFRLVLENPLDWLSISILSCTPGTLEWKRMMKADVFAGLFDNNNFYRPELYTKDSLEPLHQPTVCKNITKQELNWLVDIGYASFYLRKAQQSRLFTRHKNVPELQEFFAKIRENFARIVATTTKSDVVDYAKKIQTEIVF